MSQSQTLEQKAEITQSEERIPPDYVRCNYDPNRCNKIIRKEDAFFQGPGVYCPDCREKWFYSND